MSSCERHIFLHFVWATRDRLPFVTPEIERRLYRMMEAKVRELGCRVAAINGMPDHVHLHGYGVFSVGQDGVGPVVSYITNQKQHHADNDVWDNWEYIPITTDYLAEGAARSAP
ncbi:transposase [Armatimonas rosea]|uniref:Diadenosine tetraphosphate (Ap4A) HIT family hydrolase n=1 Tax=Armatimonas rosea TaxID=685828 RepID=A0A7W9SLX7_ARMRO|nr:transposase [Armatimonas rosea]MBB6049071.1 diadenosine tetraphosphate (Ap4A) HIT family hydrolase [Armatimonas rosea]